MKAKRFVNMVGVTAASLSILWIFLLIASTRSKRSRPKIEAALLQLARAQPMPAEGEIACQWLGVAGIKISIGHRASPPTTLLIDPYITRHSVAELIQPIDADSTTLQKLFPAVTMILTGHSHHDHLGDIPTIARITNSVIYGSRTTCALVESIGLKERCVEIWNGFNIATDELSIDVFEHPHGASRFGVPFPGTVDRILSHHPYAWEMKMGGAFAYLIRVGGKKIYHQGSAGLDDQLLRRLHDLRPDIAFIGISLRQATPDFEQRLLATLNPSLVIPIHYDNFFRPLTRDATPHVPYVDLPSFRQKTIALLGPAAYRELTPFEIYRLSSP